MFVASRAWQNQGTASDSTAPEQGERLSCSWRGEGDNRDWLGDATRWITVTVLNLRCTEIFLCERKSEGQEWVLSTGAANHHPATNVYSHTRNI